MSKYVYPAVFTKEPEGYSVSFPDVEGCHACGETLAEAMEMACDALALMLYHLEEERRPIPEASDISDIHCAEPNGDCFVTYICCDTLGYRKRYNNRAVKKTLTIPEWLNEYAVEANINFSQVLQDALKKILDEQA